MVTIPRLLTKQEFMQKFILNRTRRSVGADGAAIASSANRAWEEMQRLCQPPSASN